MSNMKPKAPNVVVTGFGPFRGLKENPSWMVVSDPKFKIDRPVNLIKKFVEVSYQCVDEVIPQLWLKHQPILMVHVGLAAFEKSLRLEKIARAGPYHQDDVRGFAPHEKTNNEIAGDKQETKVWKKLETCLDLDSALLKLNNTFENGLVKIDGHISKDAGLYVCEYIFHKSLDINRKTIFVHIPNLETKNLDEIRDGLVNVVETLIDTILDTNEVEIADKK